MVMIPLMPDPGLVKKNMKIAHRHGMPRNMASTTTYVWFYTMVRNGGEWDYKQKSRNWQNFGNFNYGAAGMAAGIPENILLRGAGFAQNHAGSSKEKWGEWYLDAPYGDDPNDQIWIKQGIQYAQREGY